MKCLKCKISFKPTKFNQKTCRLNDECIVFEAMYLLEKKKLSDAKKRNKETIEKKKALLTLSDWIKIAQATFNHFIRLRDEGQLCISCDKPLRKGNVDCGHYHSAGGHYNVRFNEDNCHAQCSRPCNKDKAGDLINYRKGLINRIGLERLDYLDSIANVTRNFTIEEVKEINETYKHKIKELKK